MAERPTESRRAGEPPRSVPCVAHPPTHWPGRRSPKARCAPTVRGVPLRGEARTILGNRMDTMTAARLTILVEAAQWVGRPSGGNAAGARSSTDPA